MLLLNLLKISFDNGTSLLIIDNCTLLYGYMAFSAYLFLLLLLPVQNHNIWAQERYTERTNEYMCLCHLCARIG